MKRTKKTRRKTQKSRDIITIDGPVGAGKSTVAKILSARLGYTYLDTGAMYRAFSLKVLREKISPDDTQSIIQLIPKTKIHFLNDSIFLDEEDVSNLIRTREVEAVVSKISAIPEVRKYIVALQKKIVSRGKIVIEGRDCGSVIAPDARYKFYLEASVEERARRRLLDSKYSGQNLSLEEVKRLIEQRDHIDKTRKDSPLRVPEGGIVINTDGLSIEEVVEKIISYVSVKRFRTVAKLKESN